MSTVAARGALLRRLNSPLSIEAIAVGSPAPDEIRVRMVATGICHTDQTMIIGEWPAPTPVILGHEGAGVVEAVGSSVRTLAIGDHVVLSFAYCGHCRSCTSGAPSYCLDFFAHNFACQRADGTTGVADPAHIHTHFFGQSSFATHAVCPATNAVKVRNDIPLELLGPLGCGIQTGAGAVLNALAVRPGATVGVFGAGAVGLSAVMAAKLVGATTIIAVDRLADRLDLARELGATITIDASQQDVAEALRKAVPAGLDYTVETTGVPAVIEAAIDVLGIRGTCGLIAGVLGRNATLPIGHLLAGGRTVRGIIEGDAVPSSFIPELIELYRQGRFPFDRLIRFYPFDEINTALADAASGVTIKPVVRF